MLDQVVQQTENLERGALTIEELCDLRKTNKLGYTYLPKGSCIVEDADPVKSNNPLDFSFFSKYDHVLKINSNSLNDLIFGRNYDQQNLDPSDIVGIQLYGNSVYHAGITFVSKKVKESKKHSKESKGIVDSIMGMKDNLKENFKDMFASRKNTDIINNFPTYVKVLVITKDKLIRKSAVLPHSYEIINAKYNGSTQKILEGGIHLDFSSQNDIFTDVETNNTHTLYVLSKGVTLACDMEKWCKLYNSIGMKNLLFYDKTWDAKTLALDAVTYGINPRTIYRKTTKGYIDFFVQ